jgi:protein phosphatase
MRIEIPEATLVILVGPSSACKSTLARRHFLPTEVVSSDRCRALVSDDETDQAATRDAFELVHAIVDKRLKRGRLTVLTRQSSSPRRVES